MVALSATYGVTSPSERHPLDAIGDDRRMPALRPLGSVAPSGPACRLVLRPQGRPGNAGCPPGPLMRGALRGEDRRTPAATTNRKLPLARSSIRAILLASAENGILSLLRDDGMNSVLRRGDVLAVQSSMEGRGQGCPIHNDSAGTRPSPAGAAGGRRDAGSLRLGRRREDQPGGPHSHLADRKPGAPPGRRGQRGGDAGNARRRDDPRRRRGRRRRRPHRRRTCSTTWKSTAAWCSRSTTAARPSKSGSWAGPSTAIRTR